MFRLRGLIGPSAWVDPSNRLSMGVIPATRESISPCCEPLGRNHDWIPAFAGMTPVCPLVLAKQFGLRLDLVGVAEISEADADQPVARARRQADALAQARRDFHEFIFRLRRRRRRVAAREDVEVRRS